MKSMKRAAALLLASAALCAALTGCLSSYENPADLPVGNTEAKDQAAAEVIAALKEAGFTNITEETWETTDAGEAGQVASMNVDGDSYFDAGDRFEADVPIEITYYVLKEFLVELTVETGGYSGMPTFSVQTNLPDETELELIMVNDAGFEQKETVEVEDGKAETGYFWDGGRELIGDYTLTVTMRPGEQSRAVRKEIGDTGDTLTGELVQTDAETGGRYLQLEQAYTSDYIPPDRISEEELIGLLEMIAQQGFGENYKIEVEGKVYSVGVWEDGLAMLSVLARDGGQTYVAQWNELVDGLETTAAALKELLANSGYGDCSILFSVLNDMDQEYVLLSSMDGAVIYDATKEE